MIKCNLPVLLAERGLKITKVSNDTGISRTTLTSLNTDSSQGIQFDTLNKLCNYLKITPGELFLYIPYEIKIEVEKFCYKPNSLNNYISFYLKLIKENKEYTTLFIGYFQEDYNTINVEMNVYEVLEEEEQKISFQIIKKTLKNLSIQFFNDLENKIKYEILSELDFEKKEVEEELRIDIDWEFLND